MDKPAILCVDDEAIILMALKQELKNKFSDRFSYESAIDAEDALKAIDELHGEGVQVILVITDWLMPGIRGDEFLMRVNSKYPDIRCIMITGHADRESIEAMHTRIGSFPILSKPWKKAELFEAVESLVN